MAKAKPISKPTVSSPQKSLQTKSSLTPTQLWIFTGLVFAMYVVYSFLSTGFYQHDEIGHYFNMLDFWTRPEAILGNSPKTGYKLFYAIPALLGNKFLVYFNAAIAAFTCLIVYKILESLKSKYALLGFFLLALQPYWIQLSFRNYADPFSGFVLAGALYYHYRQKWIPAALILSFAGIVRQEFLLLALPYGIWLLTQKRFIPFFLLGVFPLLNNIWGYLETGEIFYLITSSSKTAARYADEWPRQGFDHYFKMGISIWGVAQTAALAVYALMLVAKLTKNFKQEEFQKDYPEAEKEKYQSPLFIFASFVVYFLIHCLFNWESVKFGASTGGNLRYMTAVAPCVAILAVIGVERIKYFSNKIILLGGLSIYVAIVGVFLSYKNNNIRFTEEKDYLPFFFTIIFIFIIALLNKPKQQTIGVFVLSLLFVLFTVRPFKLTPEDLTMEKVTNSIINKRFIDEKRPVMVNHNLFKFFYDKKKSGVYENLVFLDSLTLETAPVGSIILWESHYGYRPKLYKNAINVDYFQRRPTQYTMLQNHISSDQRFQAVLLERVALK